MRELRLDRFSRRKPDKVSFSGDPITEPQRKAPSPSSASTNEPSSVRSNERTAAGENPGNSYVVTIPEERLKFRNSFDIFEDQKVALDKLQIALADLRQKASLGELVQQALDDFLLKKAGELTNFQIIKYKHEGTNERSELRP